MDYVELDKQRRELATSPEVWQFDLLSPQKMVQFAKDRAISIFNADTMESLWHSGLLRADVVNSSSPLDIPSLDCVLQEDDTFIYCDARPVLHRPEGYGGAFEHDEHKATNIKLYFHPFRLYLLYHVNRVFSSAIASTQYLLNPHGLVTLSEHSIEQLNHWTSSAQCAERFEHWNRVAELAIILEPSAYGSVFQSVRWRIPDDEKSIAAKLKVRREAVAPLLSGCSKKEIDEFRQDLCQSAEIIDRNKMIHVLLRLMSARERLKLRSSLGAAMLLLCMAEIIRRAAEEAKGESFPEEDELGFGQWMKNARKSIYGSERILDASPEVRRDFLTSMGLDSGVKVKCYVEGDTEWGAMTSAVGEGGGAEFINLRGQVIEKKGKGLSFVESLKNDKKFHVLSVVLLDGDSADNVRALRKAAADGAFFGRFSIASPDFEFANFTLDELVDVALSLSAQNGRQLLSHNEILSHVRQAKSGKEFFVALEDTSLSEIAKSTDWGIALMAYAVEHPELPKEHARAGNTRPVIEAAQFVNNARHVGFMRSLEQYKVNPETGELERT